MKMVRDKEKSYEKQTHHSEWNILQKGEASKLVLEWPFHTSLP
jgi:hypothetical protein